MPISLITNTSSSDVIYTNGIIVEGYITIFIKWHGNWFKEYFCDISITFMQQNLKIVFKFLEE